MNEEFPRQSLSYLIEKAVDEAGRCPGVPSNGACDLGGDLVAFNIPMLSAALGQKPDSIRKAVYGTLGLFSEAPTVRLPEQLLHERHWRIFCRRQPAAAWEEPPTGMDDEWGDWVNP
jgi:hypothetical protein